MRGISSGQKVLGFVVALIVLAVLVYYHFSAGGGIEGLLAKNNLLDQFNRLLGVS